MAKVQSSKTIPATPEQVWAKISSPATFPEWLTMHSGWKGEVPEKVSQGASFTEICTVMGMANKIEWTVAEYNEPSEMKITGNGMAGVSIAFTMSVVPDGDGSVASIDAEFAGQMVVGAIGSAIERSTKKEVDASLEKLAQVLA